MAKPTSARANLTRKQVERLKAPFELDLMAFYGALSEDVMKTVSRMVGDGKTPDEIIDAVEQLLEE